MKLTQRMEKALAETRRQMDYNAQEGETRLRRALEQRHEGDVPGALRSFTEAAHAWGMACAYTIALQETYRGLAGEAAWPQLDELAAKQGRYASAGYEARQGVQDLAGDEVHRALKAQKGVA